MIFKITLIYLFVLVIIGIIVNVFDYMKNNNERKKIILLTIITILLIIIIIMLYDKSIFYKLTTKVNDNTISEIITTNKLNESEKNIIKLKYYLDRKKTYNKSIYEILK